MRQPSAELQAERRKQILDAAVRCFTRSGFHGTGMQEICTEAGMSPGNLYRYFRSKTEIIAAIVDEERKQIADMFSGLVEAENFIDELGRLIDCHLAMHANRGHVTMWAEVLSEISRNAEIAAIYEGLENELRQSMQSALEKAIERNEIAPDLDPPTVALMLIALGDGLCARAAFDGKLQLPAMASAVKHWTTALLNPVGAPRRPTEPRPVSANLNSAPMNSAIEMAK
jgi:AcrR family transcriptional regulator